MAGATTGSSVIGIAFEGGVLIATDTLISYGSMARFMNSQRVMSVNDKTLVAATGDYADYQYLTSIIKQKQIDEIQWNDGLELNPAALHSWITRVAYNRRSKFQPIWCTWVVGGLQLNEVTGKNEPFLGFVDKLGTAFRSNAIATGFGQYLAIPLLREFTEGTNRLPTEAEARELVKKCMEVLYYRDARSWNKYHLAIVKEEGSTIEGPITFKGEWGMAVGVKGY